MNKRLDIQIKISEKLNLIHKLKSEITNLKQELLVFLDEKQWFTEETEIINKIENLVGRINWVEIYKDEDTDILIPVIRSRIVKINNNFI